MTGDQPPSPFELACAELRALGIILARLPGEYRVNYRNGSDASVRMAETLDEAVALGRSMAADAPAPTGPALGKRRRRAAPHDCEGGQSPQDEGAQETARSEINSG